MNIAPPTWVFMTLLFLILQNGLPCQAADALNESAKQQTRQVVCKKSEEEGALGSGFLIDHGRRLVTNWHVADCLDPNQDISGEAMVIAEGLTTIPLTLEWHSKKKDLAILRLEKPLNGSVTFATRSTLEERDPVIMAGFPGPALYMDEHYGEVSFMEGIISKFTELNGVRHIQTNVVAHHGNSGGPLYDHRGRVIGIIVAGAPMNLEQGQGQVSAPGIDYAILADELLEEMDKLSINYQAQRVRDQGQSGFSQAETQPTADTAAPPSSRPQSAPSAAPPSQPFEEPSTVAQNRATNTVAESPNTRWIWLATIVVLGLIAGIIVRTQPTQAHDGVNPYRPERDVSAIAVQNQPRHESLGIPRLRCLQGPDSGGVVPISTTPLTLGRDGRQSQWVLPPEAKKVSRRHCQIRWDGKELLTLEDCGSTAGTFMGDGRQVTAKVPVMLQPGDRFYLGSPKYMFQIEWG